MRTTFKRERSVATSESGSDDDTQGFELQCLDCYAIFESDAPASRTTCGACGSTNTTRW